MRFPTHWSIDSYEAHDRTGKLIRRDAFGWSTESDEDARRVARERAKRAVDYAITGQRAGGDYGYGVDPAREELIDEIEFDGQPVAAVTRNRYGALVLNTDDVLIADIDDAPKPGLLQRLFGNRTDPDQELIARLTAWQQDRREHTLRVYRTFAGYRVIFTDRTHTTSDSHSLQLLQALGADPLYVTLCRRQKCCRARLTPKPWRCNIPVPRARFPFASEQTEQSHRAWEDRYIAQTKSYATCRVLATIGPRASHPLVDQLVALHDAYTLNDGRPLA